MSSPFYTHGICLLVNLNWNLYGVSDRHWQTLILSLGVVVVVFVFICWCSVMQVMYTLNNCCCNKCCDIIPSHDALFYVIIAKRGSSDIIKDWSRKRWFFSYKVRLCVIQFDIVMLMLLFWWQISVSKIVGAELWSFWWKMLAKHD